MFVLRSLIVIVSLSAISGTVITRDKYAGSVSKGYGKDVNCDSDYNKVQYGAAKDVKPSRVKLDVPDYENEISYQSYYGDEIPLNLNSDPRQKLKPKPKQRSSLKPKPTPIDKDNYRETSFLAIPTPPLDNTGCNLDYNDMLNQVNIFRKQNAKKPLTYNSKLTKAAQLHSEDQAKHKSMSHTGSDGSTPGKRVDRVNYNWKRVAENVAWNQRSVTEVMTAWINSPGHKANLLGDYVDFGLGCKDYYWTQVFATLT